MYSLNRAQIIGRLTRDPELRNTTGGQSVANFGIATSYGWTDASGQKQEKTEFHNIVVWGKLAEICGQYLTKGQRAYVDGRLQTRDWETQDGQKRQRTEIVAENLIILDRPGQPGASSAGGSSRTPTAPNESPAMDKSMGEQEIKVEDIPF